MNTEPAQTETAASRAVFVAARVIVGIAGVLFCLLGGMFIWGVATDGAQWWWWIVGPAFVVCGLWFIWCAVRPRREDVTDICTTIVARVLAELF